MSHTLNATWRRRHLTAVSVAAVFLASCSRPDPAVGNCRAVRNEYLGARQDETWERFNTYDLETRYRIYICNSQGPVHPGVSFSWNFAQGGEEVAQFLADQLEATNYEATIYDIVVVFAMMQSLSTFDATQDPEMMALLEHKVAQLAGPRRASGERYLQTIRDGPGAQLPGGRE